MFLVLQYDADGSEHVLDTVSPDEWESFLDSADPFYADAVRAHVSSGADSFRVGPDHFRSI